MKLAGLPGPRRQLRRIAEDLADGRSCVWVVPDRLVDSGQARELVEDLLYDIPQVLRVPPPGPADPGAFDFFPVGGGERFPSYEPDAVVLHDYDDGLSAVWVSSGDLPGFPEPAGQAPGQVGQAVGPGLWERIGKELGAEGEPLDALLERGAGCAPVIVVCGWEEPDSRDTERLLRSLASAVKSSGLPTDGRPRVLAVVRLSDLPEAAVDSLDAETTVVHWWWSTLTRLDTATVTTVARPRPRSLAGGPAARRRVAEALCEEVITQICGSELELAARLAREWDGRFTSLAEALAACLRESGDTGWREPVLAVPIFGERPPLELRARWAAGAVDSWDGQVRGPVGNWALARDGKPTPELETMVWQAQSRVLLPLIDGARAELAALLPSAAVHGPVRLARAYGPRGYFRGGDTSSRAAAVEALAAMEVGDIWAAVQQGQASLAPGDVTRLKFLRQARNKLAHRSPLDDSLARDLARALTPNPPGGRHPAP